MTKKIQLFFNTLRFLKFFLLQLRCPRVQMPVFSILRPFLGLIVFYPLVYTFCTFHDKIGVSNQFDVLELSKPIVKICSFVFVSIKICLL